MNLSEIKNLIQKVQQQRLEESGFSRVRQIMLGQVPSVDTIAILTAENPGGEKASSLENKQLMSQFKKDLRDLEYGYTNIAGKFGTKENSLMIMNISRDDTVQLGQKYDQYAVIWGNKMREEGGEPYFKFEYIEGDQTIQTRDVSLSGQSVEDRDDYYSEKKGRKFIIPFFDDKYEMAKIKSGRLSFVDSELPNTKETEDLAESIILRDQKLRNPKGKSPKYLWHHRSVLQEEMKKLEKLIKDSSG